MTDWSTLKKLIWLRIIKGGGSALRTVTGAIVHVTNALAMPAKALSVNVSPIQDLHGYDNPWPAGGGKNKLPYPYYTQDGTLSGVTFSTAQDGKITASGTTTEGVNFFLARDISLAAGTYTLSIDGTHTALSLLARNSDANIMLASIAPSKTTATFTLEETANVRLYFNTSTVGVSVSISAYVQLEAGSTATAYAPYSNICPISGRTSATVTRTGKNLFDKNAATVGKFINASGQEIANSSKSHSELIPVKPSTAYFMNGFGNSGFFAILAVDANKQPIIWYGGASKDAPFTATMPSNCRYVYLNFNTDQIDTMAFYEGNTNEGYIPYQGNTYTIQLGDTVYGGTLDVTGGKMVVDRAMVDLGTLTWQSGWGGFYSSDVIVPTQGDAQNRIVCSHYPVFARQGSIPDHSISLIYGGEGYASNGCIYVKDTDYDNASAFKSAMSGVQLCYELATPFEITLTPTQIDTLLGQNNVWSDAGDSTLTYYAEGEASTSEALGILLGGTYNNPGGADDVSDDEALGILLGGS